MDRGDSFDADRRRRTTEGLEDKFRTPSPEEEPSGIFIGMPLMRTPVGRIEGRYEINTRGRRDSPSPPQDLTAHFPGEARAHSPGLGPEGPFLTGVARHEALWSEPPRWRQALRPVSPQTETRQPAPFQPETRQPALFQPETR